MTTSNALTVSESTAIHLPIQPSWGALTEILKEMQKKPSPRSLSLDIKELGGPLDASFSVPVAVRTSPGRSAYEVELSIDPVDGRAFFPYFRGVLALVPTLAYGCQLQIDGTYTVPFSALGKTIDMTFLRGAAATSLQRFIEQIAEDVSEWVRSKETAYARGTLHSHE